VWRLLTHLINDSHDPWKRAVAERIAMPFSRYRVLRRLLPGPMTVKEVAHAAAMDAPAATVTVNDLAERGLVIREVDPANRRSKRVSITEAGRAVVRHAQQTPDPAPASIDSLSPAELRQLRDLLRKLVTQRSTVE
jgi:DNA-binding MarR family transcriptional regulator